MIYLDTSSLLKLVLPEPESQAVQMAVAAENRVVISSLAELEAEVQLRGEWLGGGFTRNQYRRLQERLQALARVEPFERRTLPTSWLQTALRQHHSHERPHVRVLDRLHLAALEELSIGRLMTNDVTQASAAKLLGLFVVTPV